jgi:hypothetical protein
MQATARWTYPSGSPATALVFGSPSELEIPVADARSAGAWRVGSQSIPVVTQSETRETIGVDVARLVFAVVGLGAYLVLPIALVVFAVDALGG